MRRASELPGLEIGNIIHSTVIFLLMSIQSDAKHLQVLFCDWMHSHHCSEVTD